MARMPISRHAPRYSGGLFALTKALIQDGGVPDPIKRDWVSLMQAGQGQVLADRVTSFLKTHLQDLCQPMAQQLARSFIATSNARRMSYIPGGTSPRQDKRKRNKAAHVPPPRKRR